MWNFQQTVPGTPITQIRLFFPILFSLHPLHHITLSFLLFGKLKSQVSYWGGQPTPARRKATVLNILEKGRDDKVKLHGLSCYCGYSVYPIWLQMLLWLILGREAINRATASGFPHTAQGRVSPGADPTLSLPFHWHTIFPSKKSLAIVLTDRRENNLTRGEKNPKPPFAITYISPSR